MRRCSTTATRHAGRSHAPRCVRLPRQKPCRARPLRRVPLRCARCLFGRFRLRCRRSDVPPRICVAHDRHLAHFPKIIEPAGCRRFQPSAFRDAGGRSRFIRQLIGERLSSRPATEPRVEGVRASLLLFASCTGGALRASLTVQDVAGLRAKRRSEISEHSHRTGVRPVIDATRHDQVPLRFPPASGSRTGSQNSRSPLCCFRRRGFRHGTSLAQGVRHTGDDRLEGRSLGRRLMTSETSALALRAAMSAEPLVADDAADPGRERPGGANSVGALHHLEVLRVKSSRRRAGQPLRTSLPIRARNARRSLG